MDGVLVDSMFYHAEAWRLAFQSEVIVDGNDTKKSKPSPEPYLKAVQKLGKPQEAGNMYR